MPRDTALMQAIARGDLAAVSRALDEAPDPDQAGNLLVSRSATALMQASQAGRLDIVELLLGKGARTALETRVNEAETPPRWTALCFATLGGHSDVVTRLVTAGAASDPPCVVEAQLMRAIRVGAGAEVVRLLASSKPTPEGLRYALYDAIVAHDVGSVRRLLEHGADPRTTQGPFYQATPVAFAGADFPVALALVEHGGDAQQMFRAIEQRVREDQAAEAIEAGVRARVDFTPNQESLLQVAVHFGAVDAVRRLLERGESPDQRDSGGRPLLGNAVAYPEIVKQLLAKRAKVDATDNQGRSALHQAAASCQPASVALLLSAGASWRRAPGGGAALYLGPLRNGYSICPDETRLATLHALRRGKIPFAPLPDQRDLVATRTLLSRYPAAFTQLLEQAGLPVP